MRPPWHSDYWGAFGVIPFAERGNFIPAVAPLLRLIEK